jgi:hypothetical protein
MDVSSFTVVVITIFVNVNLHYANPQSCLTKVASVGYQPPSAHFGQRIAVSFLKSKSVKKFGRDPSIIVSQFVSLFISERGRVEFNRWR